MVTSPFKVTKYLHYSLTELINRLNIFLRFYFEMLVFIDHACHLVLGFQKGFELEDVKLIYSFLDSVGEELYDLIKVI